ncbi:MAG: hypothetical protein BWY98_00546 [Tenericutes bacterium ADurb.BinA155]|jgi:hypothetical protein|nr:MAG: hypothetical protein BWY98_00546 [Tenericutes bacterium ADurb.BinA155]
METDPEKIFAPVKASYDFIIANLKEIYDQLPTADQKRIFGGTFEKMHLSFDMILQNTLLRIGTADGDVSPNEAAFLARLGDMGYDLCDYVIAFGKASGEKIQVSWGEFEKAPIPTVREFCSVIDIAISPMVDSLFSMFSLVDMVTEKDYFTILEDSILQIADAFLAIDFSRSEYENNAALATIKAEILQPIVDNNIALMIALGQAKDEAEAKAKQLEKIKGEKK